MSVVFERVADQVARLSEGVPDDTQVELLRSLDQRARRVLGLFADRDMIKSSDVANILGLSERQARQLLSQWAAQGWLEAADPSKKGRKYRLVGEYKEFV